MATSTPPPRDWDLEDTGGRVPRASVPRLIREAWLEMQTSERLVQVADEQWNELDGRSSEVLAIVEAICVESCARLERYARAASSKEEMFPLLTLCSGFPGLSIIAGELAAINEDWRPTQIKAISMSVEHMGSLAPMLGLLEGVAGTAFAVEYERAHVTKAPADINTAFDELLIRALRRRPGARWDLTHGAVGVGIYGLLRRGRGAAEGSQLLDLAIAHVRSHGTGGPDGMCWPGFEWRGKFKDHNRSMNRGVAHGAAGVLGLMSLAWGAGYREQDVSEALSGSAEYLVATHRAEDDPMSQAGWCWGDMGIALQLINAGGVLDNKTWYDLGISIALEEAERTVVFRDACLCHGSAGWMHMLNRLWQSTGNDRFRMAAIRWRSQILSERRPGEGIAGFHFLEPSGVGFLNGAIGAGLALLATIQTSPPTWDVALLMSGPEVTQEPTKGRS